jgi:hypothetical protein
MKEPDMYKHLVLAILLSSRLAHAASSCDGLDGKLSTEFTSHLAPVIANQIQAERVEILKTFRLDDWSILYVDSHEADEAFLFYASDPLAHKYIALWSGAAKRNEERDMREWALVNVPGIPVKLAGCFAWYVTQARN